MRMWSSYFAITALLIWGVHAASAQATAGTLADVSRSLQQDGPAATLKRYFSCEGDGGFSLIETGDPEAVDIGIRLLAATDAGNTLCMRNAIAQALVRNPEAVLPYIDRAPRQSRVYLCFPKLIEANPARELAMLDSTDAALKRVTRADLAEARDACRQQVYEHRVLLTRK